MMSFNFFDVIIDADTGTATLEDAINLDGQRSVIPLDDLVRGCRRSCCIAIARGSRGKATRARQELGSRSRVRGLG